MAVSLRAFGRMIGVSGEAVRKAIKAGRIPDEALGYTRKGGKRIPTIKDPEAAAAAWSENTNHFKAHQAGPQRVKKPAADAEPAPADPAPPALDPRGSGQNSSAVTLQKARAMREAYDARLAQLKYEQQSGALLDKDETRRALFAAGRQLRDRMLMIPDRLAPSLAAESDQHKVAIAILQEINEGLQEFADKCAEVAGGGDPDAR